MRHVACVLLLALAACSSGPFRRGSSIRITILDAERVRLDGRQVGWDELDAFLRQRVREAREQERAKPHVDLDAMQTVAAQQTNRMIELLAAAGIRSIEILPIRR